jgi:hypothetical protein
MEMYLIMANTKITPEIIEDFKKYFHLKIKDKKTNIDVIDLKLGDTQAVVTIDNVRVGKLYAYFSDREMPQDTIMYFFPDYSFFDHCHMNAIHQFMKYSEELLKNTLVTLNVDNKDSSLVIKKVLDYRFDLQKEEDPFYVNFCSKDCTFFESGNLVYRFVKHDDEFKLIDDFQYCINNNMQSMLDVNRYTSLLSVILVKEDNMYAIKDNSYINIYSIEFDENDPLPDITHFADLVFYYAIMNEFKIECPVFEDFFAKIEDYKKIVEMHII